MSDARKIEIRPIDPDDDGVDPAWLELPGSEKVERMRRLMLTGLAFEEHFTKRRLSYRVDKTANVFEGLPRSRAAFYARRQRPEP
ncbi:MAG TPA: hypothetical protein VNT60_11340 [Deinococcales bacterium]|nr:hypothetical protein [Deinococcales bacterium]